MKRKKILLIVRWPVGGIRTFILYVYGTIDSNLWQISILAPGLAEMQTLVHELSPLGARFICVEEEPTPFRFFAKVATEIAVGDYDLVHSHGFTAGMCAALPAYLRRTPHLMTSHETLNDKQFLGPKGKMKRAFMEVLFRLIDVVHSVSHDAHDNLLTFFPAQGRRRNSVVIPNGVAIERFHRSEPRDLRGELGLGKEAFLIGFLGRFMSPKGFRYLVDAIHLLLHKSDLPRRPIVVAFGYGAFIREEQQAIRQKGLQGSFFFMPFATETGSVIKGVDVVVMPSLWEACGLLAMETLVCGIPLIGSDCVGLREVLKGTPAVVVPKGDSSSLADALERELRSSSMIAFRRFQKTAYRRFDVRATWSKMEELYKCMVNGDRPC